MIIRDRKEFYALTHEMAEASRDFGCKQILDEDLDGFDKISSGERMADLSSLDEALKRVCTGCRHYKMGLSRSGGKAMDTTDGIQSSGLSLFLFLLN